MTPQINEVLKQIHRKLETEAAWGPEVPPVDEPGSHYSGAPGDGGAENETDIEDAVDFYFDNIVDRLTQEFGMSDEEGMDLIYSVADDMADEGMIPPMPGEEDDEEAVAAWLGKAKSVMLGNACILAARQRA
jgi:hypothetical protein